MRYRILLSLVGIFAHLGASVECQEFRPTGAQTVFEALDPLVMKWRQPQTLYYQYHWEPWKYSNYAKDLYERYVNIELEGTKWYDLYGDYIMKGWQLYDWSQTAPTSFGTNIVKNSRFRSWFNGLMISNASKGQYHFAVTAGEEIRTTLTPLTF